MISTWKAIKTTLSVVWRGAMEIITCDGQFKHMKDYSIPQQLICFVVWCFAWAILINAVYALYSAWSAVLNPILQ